MWFWRLCVAVWCFDGVYIQDRAVFAATCQRLLADCAWASRVATYLPTSLSLRQVMPVQPKLSPAALRLWIEMELAALIPYSLEEAIFDYEPVLKENAQQMEVEVIVAQKAIVQNWSDSFKEAGFPLGFLEPELHASQRADASGVNGGCTAMTGVAMRLYTRVTSN